MGKKKLFRKLTTDEIKLLEQQGCRAQAWNMIDVDENFTPQHIHHVHFSGTVQLGSFEKLFILPGGVPKHAGIYRATIHNCVIDDDVLIENVSQYIANYRIGKDSRIQNIDRIVVTNATSFANGTPVSVLNEVGGREVPMFNNLSAHLAYIIALYRHNPQLIRILSSMISDYAQEIQTTQGVIAYGCTVIGCGTIENVYIGDFATLDGVSRLSEGSINSTKEAPIFVGHNVVAERFIFSSGAHISDGATVVNSFIGQACHISKLFSMHDSLFFSNCQGENGEACAVFAGPYTVSMHKSSLLIAGMFSFLNAGSGSNQSNHLYKLGPIHQGIVERGSKTTSDSYILWPAKIGPFSLIMGRHVEHPDTSNLPFSYLIERNNTTTLVPAVNLRSVGTIRDVKKWPQRDKRTDRVLLDKINFNLLSPFTIRKMLNGIDILRSLKELCGENTPEYSYNNVSIKHSSLNKGIELYSLAIVKFLGNSLISRLADKEIHNNQQLRALLTDTHKDGLGEWIDLSGLIVPKKCVTRMIHDIEQEKYPGITSIENYFTKLHTDYYDMEWTWAWHELQLWYHVNGDDITVDDVVHIISDWKDAVITLDNMLYEDARKEFSLAVKVGFGMDGKSGRKEKDFEYVRGDFDNNPFVKSVQEHIIEKTELGDLMISQLLKYKS
ncbi:MAG: DUF4954 family protein [Marinifilaceae bacterium]